jgi:hypothetical protein
MIKGEAAMKQNIIYVGLDVDDTQYHWFGSGQKYWRNHYIQMSTDIKRPVEST